MGRPDVASVSWMKGQWLVIEVITLLGGLDIRIIRSAHIVQCHWSLELANQKPVFRVSANETAKCDTGQSCRLSVTDPGALNATQISVAVDPSPEIIQRKHGESWPWMCNIVNLQCNVLMMWGSEAIQLLLTVSSAFSSLHYNHYTSIHTITSCM